MSKSKSKIIVKHGKKKHKNVDIGATDTFDVVQGIIFSLTQVIPSRQKIIVGGKQVNNDDDVKQYIIGKKKKVLISVMGSNQKGDLTSSLTTTKQFIEDMDDSQKQKFLAELPPGLYNLGNTCYLNSCLQVIKSINVLKEYLCKYVSDPNNNINNQQNTLSTSLGKLMIKLNSSSDAVYPSDFVQHFRGAFPRFASRNDQGIFEQQDADEAYTEIISALRQDNNLNDASGVNIINKLFEGEYESNIKCIESVEEPELNITEKFVKLQCFIDINSRHINDGIGKSMNENLEKRSSKLDRNAIWTKTRSISKLPQYIPVQLVRFYWKQKTQKNAKILRKIIFPEKLDIYEFCNDKLKKCCDKYRKLKLEKEDREREKKQAIQAINDKKDKDKDKNKGNVVAAAVDNNAPTANDNDNDKDKANDNQMDVDNANDDNDNNVDVKDNNDDDNDNKMNVDDNDQDIDLSSYHTGYYELVGIVTHKGRSANSGHYIGYAKDNARKKWLKFDDENTSAIKSDEIRNLYGGGDFQMAFFCVYKRTEIDPNIFKK